MPQDGPTGTPESAPRGRRTLSVSASVCAPALRIVDATFVHGDSVLVRPFSLELSAGERGALTFGEAGAARIAARMAAGIVKATSGTLLVCQFDPRIQPVQAKRLAGYVPWKGNFGDGLSAADAIDVHAALFEVARDEARTRVRATLAEIGWEDRITFAVALALLRPIALLVLDRPPPATLARVAEVAGESTALLATRIAVRAPAPVLAAP